MASRPSTKESLLDAAEAVVSESGAAHLTLDAVAHKAEVSKGGLLYHFPSKEVLLQEMLTRLCERFDAKKAPIRSQEGAAPSADLRAHLRTAFAYMQENKRVSAAILAAGANDPRLLLPIRERVAKEVAGFKGNAQQVARALVIFLAVDGLWYNELLDIMSLEADVRGAVLNELLELAESAAPAGEVPR